MLIWLKSGVRDVTCTIPFIQICSKPQVEIGSFSTWGVAESRSQTPPESLADRVLSVRPGIEIRPPVAARLPIDAENGKRETVDWIKCDAAGYQLSATDFSMRW